MLFTCYICFTYFAVLNVVTGVFCQNAIQVASENEDLLVLEQIKSRELLVQRIRKLFDAIDVVGLLDKLAAAGAPSAATRFATCASLRTETGRCPSKAGA